MSAAVTASWVGDLAYSRPAGDQVTASWHVEMLPAGSAYRLALDPTLDPLPLAAIQCRRRRGASTWLSATLPTWSRALEQALIARIGATLAVSAVAEGGWKPFLSAILTNVSSDVGPQQATLTLTGRVQTPRYTAAVRRLQGISRRGSENGRSFCRCALDPLLRPNDTVDDGAASWTAGAIAYRIEASRAEMEVTEVDG